MTYEERMQWFHKARFGLYIHYGLYSLLGRGEWTMYSERISPAEYAVLADSFRPDPGAAKEWCEAAKLAGAEYVVLTTRHHEGFSLFDSKYSDFTSAKHGCRRDIVREYVTAAREAGLKVGLYYSLLDWRYPGYFEPEKYPESKAALVEYVHNQVRELMTGYGQIDLLEYDGGWMHDLDPDKQKQIDFWRADELNAMVRQLQPQIIVLEGSSTQIHQQLMLRTVCHLSSTEGDVQQVLTHGTGKGTLHKAKVPIRLIFRHQRC
jgi:alpha-L-fucosidase